MSAVLDSWLPTLPDLLQGRKDSRYLYQDTPFIAKKIATNKWLPSFGSQNPSSKTRQVYLFPLSTYQFKPPYRPLLAGNRTAKLITIDVRTASLELSMPAAKIIEVIRYTSSIIANTGEDAQTQPVFNQ